MVDLISIFGNIRSRCLGGLLTSCPSQQTTFDHFSDHRLHNLSWGLTTSVMMPFSDTSPNEALMVDAAASMEH